MEPAAYLTLAILVGVFGLLLATQVPPVAVFLGALTLCLTFELAPVEECLRGFANPGVLTIGVLFMVAAGMHRTGAINLVVERLLGRPRTLLAAQLKILLPVAAGSAFLNNTPIVAMFIPVIRDLARSTRLEATRLYIPLSYATILGGTCTLIGTATNLVLAGLIRDYLSNSPQAPIDRLGMFAMAPVAVPVTLVGLAFIILTSRWLLPGPRKTDVTDRLKRWYRCEFVVLPDSPLINRTVGDLGYLEAEGLKLLECRRVDGRAAPVAPETVLAAGDRLCFAATFDVIPTLWDTKGLEPAQRARDFESKRFSHRLVEAVVSPQCPEIGRRIGDLPLADSACRFALVGLSRLGQAPETRLAEVRLEASDDLILEVEEDFFHDNLNEVMFSLTKRLTGVRFKRYDRAVTALGIMAAMVAAASLGWLSMLTAALLATGAMLLTGCMTSRWAGRHVDFDILIIIASAMGLGAAVQASGLAAALAQMLTAVGGRHPVMALIMVYLGCILMNALVTNVASAVFMFPVAMNLAADLGVNPMPFLMTLLIGASASFISPWSYQTNLMVLGPGSYRFSDFARIGIPLTLVVGLTTVLLAPIFWPF
jgi:di/tricarboxylate transporter